jgi:hypothetical protein
MSSQEPTLEEILLPHGLTFGLSDSHLASLLGKSNSFPLLEIRKLGQNILLNPEMASHLERRLGCQKNDGEIFIFFPEECVKGDQDDVLLLCPLFNDQLD